MKKCNGCGESLPETSFSWKNKARGYRNSRCRSCHKAYAAEHYKNNSDSYKARTKRDRPKLYAQGDQYIKEHLRNNPCVDCGESDIRVLQFDHRDSVGNKALRVGHYRSSLGRLIQEIAKCDIRCANCHMRRTFEQQGWSRI